MTDDEILDAARGVYVKPLTKRERLAMTKAHPSNEVVHLLEQRQLTHRMSFQYEYPRLLTPEELEAMAKCVAAAVGEFLKALPEEPRG